MNDKNIDSQSESILLYRAREFKAADKRALTDNIVIFIVIVLGVNGALNL